MWNLHNPKQERFFSGKTRQIHRTHLTTYDHLWSNIPWVNPMATITQDSLADYGFDNDNCNVHDVIGTRCDPYTLKRIAGEDCDVSCHQILTKAIEPYGLTEYDVHDVFNIFMCSGFDKKTREYIIRYCLFNKHKLLTIEWFCLFLDSMYFLVRAEVTGPSLKIIVFSLQRNLFCKTLLN